MDCVYKYDNADNRINIGVAPKNKDVIDFIVFMQLIMQGR
jgi:hypothetical protein